MTATIHEQLRRLAALAPMTVPPGEPGVTWHDDTRTDRLCVPVLSIYLDWRPIATGGRPGERAARVVLLERMRQIERTFLPRGAALDSLRQDSARINEYVASAVAPATKGVAIFTSAAHHLFETLEVDIPFDTQVSAGATPDLFQLVRLLSGQETAVIAVVDLRSARLFVTLRGGLRELERLVDDPKLFHMVRGENAMNQARYQRHAGKVRTQFAQEVADHITWLVDHERATEVILAGHTAGMALVREALAPRIAGMLHEPMLAMDVDAPRTMIAEEIAPVLDMIKAQQERSTVERLVGAVQAGILGVAGLDATLEALRAGQAETLVLAEDEALPPETRGTLIELATNTDAAIEVVDNSATLRQLGGVGALLRYRTGAPTLSTDSDASVSEAPGL